ncbi:MAG TPA: MerR family transcriptional regulator [Williamsia sp.]
MLIGELSRCTGISARMLRHHDSLGLVSSTGRSTAGYREYSRDDIVRIFRVESLRSLGMSLREVQRALDDPDFTPGSMVGELIDHA